MPQIVEGNLVASGLRFGIVQSRFNNFITDRLLEGALDAIARCGGDTDSVVVYRTPGAFEIPQVLRRVAGTGRFDALICIGAVIRGATPHFDFVAAEAAKGVAAVANSVDVPIAFGILTPDTIEQAIERAGTKAGNKGFEAAMAAIEQANLKRVMDAR